VGDTGKLNSIGSGYPGLFYLNTVPISKQFTLGSRERIKSRKLIDKLFGEGRSFVRVPYRVYFQFSREPPKAAPSVPVQFGVAVSKRLFRKAVDRNRIKRLSREAFRLQKIPLQDLCRLRSCYLAVFFVFTSKEIPDYHELSGKMLVILNRFMTLAHEDLSAHP
jgi:ribonuclease P protein component